MPTVKLDVLAVAVAIAVVWGAAVLIVGLAAWITDWGRPFVTVLGSIYPGYAPGILGSLIGLLWALLDGAIAGALYAWIYNLVAARRAVS